MTSIFVCDIGGTYTRVAIFQNQKLQNIRKYKTAKISDLNKISEIYLKDENINYNFDCLMFAAAGMVVDGKVTISASYQQAKLQQLDIKKVRKITGCKNIKLLNDYEALAHSIKEMPKEYYKTIRKSEIKNTHNIVLGAGTGLGVAVLRQNDEVISTEAGRLTLPYIDFKSKKNIDLNKEITTFGDVLSGNGVKNIYKIINPENFLAKKELQPEQIMKLAHDEKNELGVEIKNIIQISLGVFSRLMSLIFVGSSDIFLNGGVFRANIDQIIGESFYTSFQNDEMFKTYLEKIGIHIITSEYASFYGLLKASKAN